MKIVKTIPVVLALSLLIGAMSVSSVRAQDDNAYLKRTLVTFSQQVEIPGQFLPAGTYTMELLNLNPNRHIVRFFNADRTKLVAARRAVESESIPRTRSRRIRASLPVWSGRTPCFRASSTCATQS